MKAIASATKESTATPDQESRHDVIRWVIALAPVKTRQDMVIKARQLCGDMEDGFSIWHESLVETLAAGVVDDDAL